MVDDDVFEGGRRCVLAVVSVVSAGGRKNNIVRTVLYCVYWVVTTD